MQKGRERHGLAVPNSSTRRIHRPLSPVGRTIAVTAFLAGLLSTAGTARAGLENERTLVDGQGRTLTIQQWDTFLNGVYPLDRNRLSREWFQSGKAFYSVTGAGADQFEGTLELGYQIGFPWATGVGINFSYTTANVAYGGQDYGTFGMGVLPAMDLVPAIVTPPLFPGVSISADLGNGPGIQEVATLSIDVTGPNGAVIISGAHGTVTGAAGGVMLRPYARLLASTGDSVSTYGAPWNMN